MTDEKMKNWIAKHPDFYRAMAGDSKATEKVIGYYIKFAHKWANYYRPHFPEHVYDDLIQEGIEGIIKGIKTFDVNMRQKDGNLINPSTWLWWKIRASVQRAYRRYYVMFKGSIDKDINDMEVADDNVFELPDDRLLPTVEDLLIEGCGSLVSKRAYVVIDKFGLLGNTPLHQSEISRKHNLSRQATSRYIQKFVSTIKKKYPNLSDTF